MPLLVTRMDTVLMKSIALTREAADLGAAAVVVTPPYYFPEGQPELVECLEDLIAELPLPLVPTTCSS